jgi:hypothetical protein
MCHGPNKLGLFADLIGADAEWALDALMLWTTDGLVL